jgi:HNH endonuclease
MAQRWSADQWMHATLTLNMRQRGRCPACGRSLDNDVARHHRQRRRDGGDTLSNLVMLHTACHRWVHAHPEEARELGLIVSFAGAPLNAPLYVRGRGWVLLDDEGGEAPVDSGGAAVSLGSGPPRR